MKRATRDPEETFARRTRREGECLVWTGVLVGRGYGRFTVEGKAVMAHRYAWERVNGPVPEGMVVDHICHNKSCVEIAHLRLATPGQNSANRSGAQKSHKSTGVRNVYPNKKGFRVTICKGRKLHHFGTYPTLDEAAKVADEKRREMFGEYAGDDERAA